MSFFYINLVLNLASRYLSAYRDWYQNLIYYTQELRDEKMVPKGKGKVTFKQRALMFSSRGELSTAAMAEVLRNKAESSKNGHSRSSSSAPPTTKPSASASVQECLTPRSSANSKSSFDPDCLEVHCLSDSTAVEEVGPIKKKRAKAKCRFQTSWAAKYPWCEQQVFPGDFDVIRCTVCTKVNGRDYLLDSKSDGLAKHQGWTKVLKDIPSLGVKRNEYYWNKDLKHMKAE